MDMASAELRPGECYRIIVQRYPEKTDRVLPTKCIADMRLIAKYPHIAQFEQTDTGRKEAFSYWYLERNIIR